MEAQPTFTSAGLDALPPAEVARKAENVGVAKAGMSPANVFALSILAGAFIALGAIFATTTMAGGGDLPYGVVRLLGGLTFTLGLILVIVAGAELFTGNNLIVMAWASRKVRTLQMLRNWAIVYLGNFVGALGTAAMVFLSRQHTMASGTLGMTALGIALAKVQLGFVQAVALGVVCNILVCLAVWLSFSARSSIDRIAAILFPITAFVAGGFEHSVANMYFIPIGLAIKTFDPAYVLGTGMDLSGLTWSSFLLRNLLPVTLGNILGGSIFVAAVYWSIFLRQPRPSGDPPE
jgi:formate/nitrite transporter